MYPRRLFMKNFLTMVLTALCFAAFCGCAGEDMNKAPSNKNLNGNNENIEEAGFDGNFPGLPAAIEQRVIQDFKDAFPDSVDPRYGCYISGYYGTYNGCVAVSITRPGIPHPDVVWDETIAGITLYDIDYPTKPLVWKDGRFYTGYEYTSGVKEAYDSGLLAEDDVRSIAGLFNDRR
jgi:hypothetical protein